MLYRAFTNSLHSRKLFFPILKDGRIYLTFSEYSKRLLATYIALERRNIFCLAAIKKEWCARHSMMWMLLKMES